MEKNRIIGLVEDLDSLAHNVKVLPKVGHSTTNVE
jgi:hypothetical protein